MMNKWEEWKDHWDSATFCKKKPFLYLNWPCNTHTGSHQPAVGSVSPPWSSPGRSAAPPGSAPCPARPVVTQAANICRKDARTHSAHCSPHASPVELHLCVLSGSQARWWASGFGYPQCLTRIESDHEIWYRKRIGVKDHKSWET